MSVAAPLEKPVRPGKATFLIPEKVSVVAAATVKPPELPAWGLV